MTNLILLAAAFSAILGLYVFLVSGTWKGWRKLPHVFALVALLVGQAITFTVMLGHAKPVTWGLGFDDAILIDVIFDEPRTIYVVLKMDDLAPPMLYQFAWNTELAKKLYKAIQDGRALAMSSGGGFGMFSGDGPLPVVHPRPPARYTDKDMQKN